MVPGSLQMSDKTNGTQIDQDRTGHEASVHGLAVEDVEVLVGLHLGLAVDIDVVLLVNHFPELCSDLRLSSLSRLPT